MKAAFMLAGEHIYQNCIDAKGRRLQPFNGHIGRGIAKFTSALLAMFNRAFEPVPMAQHGRGALRICGGKSFANIG